ncbi:MAG: ATP-binding protein [Alphaproteobacteria bacterium]|nr:ATP-binding protein [Alphaproteobacteria bacterium]
MIIERQKYLQDLIDRKQNNLIKVITGLRRVGKSFLLFDIFYEYLISIGVRQVQIIQMQLDMKENEKYRNPDVFLEYVKQQITDQQDYYIFIDEIQMMDDFSSVLNSLLHIKNVDVYVTGSNSKFLSKDVLTEFRGRGDEVHVYPLSFSEFLSAYSGSKFDAWKDYYTFGGLPLILTKKSDEQKSDYLKNLFQETYLKDIKNKYNVKNDRAMEDILNILSSSVGSLTNVEKISNTFKTVLKSEISPNTINSYLEYLQDAFLINKVNRYDVKGRKYIGTPLKYYFEDVGLRNAWLNFRQQEENHIMENVIYNELRCRGYNVDVGVVECLEKKEDKSKGYNRKKLEIDFVVNQSSKRFYIQSAFEMSNFEKMEQEKKSLKKIMDGFKKIILVQQDIKLSRDEYGIVTMGVLDFLLNKDSLNL